MDFVKRNWTQIQAQINDWSFATKSLIGSLVVIMLLVGGIFVWLAGSADMVPLNGYAEGGSVEIVEVLKAGGVEKAVAEGGQVLVPASDQELAIAVLAQSGHLRGDAQSAFTSLVSSQSFLSSSRQSEQQVLAAKSAFLSRVASEMRDVDHASVMLDKPASSGFGRSYAEPSATIAVSMQSGKKVNRQLANALIDLVRGSVARMPAENITVTDLGAGRSFTADDQDEMMGGDHLEGLIAQERLHRTKIENVLGNIPGLTLSVKIVTSQVVGLQRQSTEYGAETLESTRIFESSTSNGQSGGEPGTGANLTANIQGSGGTSTQQTQTESEERFNAPQVTSTTNERIRGSMIRLINVSVAVPRSYFVSVYMAQNPDAEPPSDDDLQAIFESEKTKIEELVKPQMASSDELMEPGKINIAMVYDRNFLDPVAAGSGGGLGAVLQSEWTSTAMAAGLAFVALAFMFNLVRKATRAEELPSLDELAGVPPQLPTDDDLMGEVDEMDGGLAGVELNEEDLRSRQIAEQISDLVKANPEEAAGLLGKWVGSGNPQ